MVCINADRLGNLVRCCLDATELQDLMAQIGADQLTFATAAERGARSRSSPVTRPELHRSERSLGPTPEKLGPRELRQLKTLLSTEGLLKPVELTEDHVLSILAALRARHAIFGPNLFSDPAWDLLLELYAAKLGFRRMTVQDAAIAIDVPGSTTRRWIALLKSRGLVEVEVDKDQPARRWVSLTAHGAAKMKQLADHWGSAFLSI
jgi:DNA-binding MarR family transcriptional regulator